MLAFSLNRSDKLGVGSLTHKHALYLVFSVYVLLLTTAVINHERWMDEAQAWLLVKDLSLSELFLTYLRYEGSPGLWHLILMLPAKLGFPYYTINIISATFSAIGVWLFLRYSPFPLIIKILLPFTYFAFFQYGVVARSYCLIPGMMFLIAMMYRKKDQQPLRYVLLLCLLANISAHTFLIACCLLFIHFTDLVETWNDVERRKRIENIAAFGIFGLMAIGLVLMLLPPSDQIFAGQVRGALDNFKYTPKMVASSLALNEVGFFRWPQEVLSGLVFIVSIIWFVKKKVAIIYILPLIIVLCFSAIVYKNVWHQGILFFLWMFVLWLSFEQREKEKKTLLYKNMVFSIVLVLCFQIYWTTQSFSYDLNKNYSASYQVASYIKANKLEEEKIFATGWKSISVLPYFDKNIFYNLNNGSDKRFWFWSTYNKTDVGVDSCVIEKVQKDQPSVVIIASHYVPKQKTVKFEGYNYVGLFKGFLCWKTRRYEPESYLLFRRDEKYLTKKSL